MDYETSGIFNAGLLVHQNQAIHSDINMHACIHAYYTPFIRTYIHTYILPSVEIILYSI